MFWLLIVTKIICSILLIFSPLHFVINGRELWIIIICLICCVCLLLELILVEPYFLAKNNCLNVFRYIIQAISCFPCKFYPELSGRKGKKYVFLLYSIAFLLRGFNFDIAKLNLYNKIMQTRFYQSYSDFLTSMHFIIFDN